MARKRAVSNNPAGRPRSMDVTARIHAALLDLLTECPYHALSLDGISVKAGVSRPSFYRRYANVGQATLGALLEAGGALPMPQTDDLGADLCSYFRSVVAVLEPGSIIGRALRGVLASALTDPALNPHFAAFIDQRREPVRQRLSEWNGALTPAQLERTLDAMFGPTLYRLLIRQVGVEKDDIESIVRSAIEGIG